MNPKKEVDIKISKYLASIGNTYEPFHFSLNEKLEHASEIKRIVNDQIKFIAPELTPNESDHLKKIEKTGITQFDTPFLDEDQLSDIHSYLSKQQAYPAHIPYYDKEHPIRHPYNYKGQILSFDTKTIVEAPHLINLLSSRKILNVVTHYLGTTPTFFDLNIIFSFGGEEKYHETQHFHRDHDDFHHCLLMVYLNDVDMESGGHLYATNSHQEAHRSSSIAPTIGANNSVTDTYDHTDNFVMETVIGRRGTGFISDANGLHAGSVPAIGKRRMIFWARYGLGENYMWKHHNHRYWGFSNRTFAEKVNNQSYSKNCLNGHVFRFFTDSYDVKEARSISTKGDGCMRKTVKYGWNIGVYGKNYFAMKQSDGSVAIEDYVERDDTLEAARKKLSKNDILVSDNELELIESIKIHRPYPQVTGILSDQNGYNIAAYGKNFFAVPQSIGAINLEEIVSLNDDRTTLINKTQHLDIIVHEDQKSLLEIIL
tara:strand:- start:11766 stop:13217 length:1452 start_codon:yes stop_codon:yes gene_type:complete